jgi:uncharacterized phage infection (PIP) family protein YhgE
MDSNTESRPNPDPTVLTTDQLHREIEQLKELFSNNISCLEKVRAEERRATEMAEREREKAAQALAASLRESQRADVESLLNHINSQYHQVSAALTSEKELTEEKVNTVNEKIESQNDEMVLRDATVRDLLVQANNAYDIRVREAFDASQEAIKKAEDATEKRIEGLNNKYNEQIGRLEKAMPREVAEARLDEMRQQILALSEKLGKLT